MQAVQLAAEAEQARQVRSQAEQLLEERSWKVPEVQLARQCVPLRKSEPLHEEQVLPLLQVRQVERQLRQLVLVVYVPLGQEATQRLPWSRDGEEQAVHADADPEQVRQEEEQTMQLLPDWKVLLGHSTTQVKL